MTVRLTFGVGRCSLWLVTCLACAPPIRSKFAIMGLLTFAINVTLAGCVDHRAGIADDETHDFFTQLMDATGAMLWGRVTYEMMESYWPSVARGEGQAPSAKRAWAVKLLRGSAYGGSFTTRPQRAAVRLNSGDGRRNSLASVHGD